MKPLLFALAALTCRADLITFPSLSGATAAAVSPLVTPPGLVAFPGSDWVTPIGSNVYTLDFTVPAGFDIVGASLGIKTNGPFEATVNGFALANVTNSTILNILPFVHDGLNVLQTPFLLDAGPGLKVDVEAFVFGYPAPASTPEPGTLGIVGLALCWLGWRLRC